MILTIGTGTSAKGFNPSEMEWSLMDISAPESGRDLEGKMWKNRLPLPDGQKRKLVCKWNNIGWTEASRILSAVQEEYLTVTYPDILTGTMRTSEFYVGDRTAPVYMWLGENNTSVGKILSNVALDFIER